MNKLINQTREDVDYTSKQLVSANLSIFILLDQRFPSFAQVKKMFVFWKVLHTY